MKFLHAADLHIDSPLRGLDIGAGAPVERLRGATRRATETMIDIALRERVDFVIVAGDVFDGPWHDMRTGIWTSRQFARLTENGEAGRDVPVYLLRGNHDAQSKVRQAVTWPGNVHEFSVDHPETYLLPSCNVALHGQGFANPQVNEDLAAGYPDARSGMVNIGVLHTSLNGDPNHDTYAPTTEAVLIAKGYDYWALGHVHQRRMVRPEHPCIAYSGNTQGRHIKEVDAKGCLIVEMDSQLAAQRRLQVTFHETDCLRWIPIVIDLADDQSLTDVFDSATRRFERAIADNEGRFVVARVELRGACAAHGELLGAADVHEATAELRNRAAHLHQIWLEKVIWRTAPLVDLAELRRGQDLLGELLRDLNTVDESPESLMELADALSTLEHRAPAKLKEAGISLSDPKQLRQWLKQAEGMLVSLLQEEAAASFKEAAP